MSDHQPPPGELVGAVIEFLATTVRPALTGYPRFETLIAIRLLQIAAADYERGAELRAREQQRLAALLGHDGAPEALERELVERIRRGVPAGEERAALLEHLRAGAREQLELANPAYLRDP
ncbi:MAG: DUF6285 domain-containing protein [Solirubrobacteraceae bacterium]|jgi:hypothetical protein|nr:DUF6285 domain-containing protein [Solirubrobacteraceae bacterium]